MDHLFFTISNGTLGVLFMILFLAIAVKEPKIRSARFMTAAFFWGTVSLILHEIEAYLNLVYLGPTIRFTFCLAFLMMARALAERVGWTIPAITVPLLFVVVYAVNSLAPANWDIIITDLIIAALVALPLPRLYQKMQGHTEQAICSFLLLVVALTVLRPVMSLLEIHPSGIPNREFHIDFSMFSTFVIGLLGANLLFLVIASERIHLLASAALIDPLTGLMNRRGLIATIDDSEAKRKERPTQGRAVAVFDIDHFKHVNDEFGHEAGDQVLEKIGYTVSDLMKHYGEASRSGGEEFTLLFKAETSPAAFLAAEHLRVAVSLLVHDSLPADRRVTISLGLAYVREEEALKRTIKRADLALYAAKDAGRNRMRLAEGDVPPDAGEAEEVADNRHLKPMFPEQTDLKKLA